MPQELRRRPRATLGAIGGRLALGAAWAVRSNLDAGRLHSGTRQDRQARVLPQAKSDILASEVSHERDPTDDRLARMLWIHDGECLSASLPDLQGCGDGR